MRGGQDPFTFPVMRRDKFLCDFLTTTKRRITHRGEGKKLISRLAQNKYELLQRQIIVMNDSFAPVTSMKNNHKFITLPLIIRMKFQLKLPTAKLSAKQLRPITFI